jgi:hypothetical protein
VLKDPMLDTTEGSGIDPVADGAFLHVFNDAGTGDSACFRLPASGWVRKGKTATPTFKYEDKSFTHGPCKVSVVKDAKLLRLVCLSKGQPIDYSLDEPAQTSVAARFGSGSTEYCTVFGGTVRKDLQNKKFKAGNAPAPLACPTPPVPCP